MIEVNNTTKIKINKKLIIEIAEKFFKVYKLKNKELSIAFISDQKMRRLNKNYRGLDKTTDILSFNGEDDFLGEIIISPLMIKKQAKENKNPFKYELSFIFVHGLLHLIGYDDETEKGRLKMIKLGEDFLNKIR